MLSTVPVGLILRCRDEPVEPVFGLQWKDSDDVSRDHGRIRIMDVYSRQLTAVAILWFSSQTLSLPQTQAGSPEILFDMPSVTAANDTSLPAGGRIVSCSFSLSTLVSDSGSASSAAPPIDHMLIRCRLRDRSQVVDFEPKTELASEFASPISVTKKNERTDSIGLSIDGHVPPYGGGQFGVDDTKKRSDSHQYQQQAPMQAVIASGTTDRSRGVYFKFRWTSTQVLEGERYFQVSFAVPQSWRGGLADVSVTALGIDRSMFGSKKLKPVARQTFVVAVHQEHDHQAAGIAMRLAKIDRQLVQLAQQHARGDGNGMERFWRKVLNQDNDHGADPSWYQSLTRNQADPYVDRQIRSLPMPIRVAVLGYADTARELRQLGGDSS